MENHKEDILKKFLQDTFSDYEPEPSDASWETIFSAIQPNQPTFWGKSKPWIASVLVILTGAWLWYSSSNVAANNVEIALASGQVGTLATDVEIAFNTHEAGKLVTDEKQIFQNPWSESSLTNLRQHSEQKKTVVSGRVETLATDEILPIYTDKINKNQRESVKSQYPLRQYPLRQYPLWVPSVVYSMKEDKYSKEIIVKNNTPKEEGENHPTVERQLDETVISRDNLIASTSERVETPATDIIKILATDVRPQILLTLPIYTDSEIVGENTNKGGNTDKKFVSKNTNKGGRMETLVTDKVILATNIITENAVIEQVRYIHPLESLRNKDFMFSKIALSSPVITPVLTPNREAKPVRQHTYLSLSITPIQTYRILTINNNYVQNVQVDNLFDSERNGWEFNLGVIKPIGKLWNFRANLSYLRMRQWSQYQIGTYELVLRNNNNNTASKNSNPPQGVAPELEVVGQTVTESKNLHMVGLKMDVQKFFKITPKNRYFISTGTQVMYENSQKQSNVFVNISAGFQHIVSKTTFLTIEPTASYSLNNFNDSKSLLQANGYNLGLKMGVNFKVK